MFVTHHMTRSPKTVTPETPIREATAILAASGFRHLPVVDRDRRLVGMVTDRDLRSASASSIMTDPERQELMVRLQTTPVERIMTRIINSLGPDSTLDDAVYLFDRDRVGALPVIDAERRLLGILSIRDLLGAYKRLYGLGEKGSALVVVVPANGRTPAQLVLVLEENGIRFSRLVLRNDAETGNMIYLRVHTFNLKAVHELLEKSGFSIVPPPVG